MNNTKKSSEEDFEPVTQVFHNLMPFKVREILLVSSLYDAFIVEEEGLISEMVIWEYRHLLLSSPPRVSHVASGKEALSKLKTHRYDLVITMSKNIGMDPFEFGQKIKQICPDLPIILLATDTADLHFCQEHIFKKGVDQAFFWYGDTSLFMAIIKYVEDMINAPYDTVNSNVQVIIIIEDSIHDYSLLLPAIYREIMQQTQRSISEDLNEMQRLLRRRARPKIFLANNYERAIELFKEYNNNLLGIISDIKFPRNGKTDLQSGLHLVKYVKNTNPFLPIMLRSSNLENKKKAEQIGSYFSYKKSPELIQDLNHFLIQHLGFGDFIFLLPTKIHKKVESDKKHHITTTEIAKAENLKEFEKVLQKIPLESIRFHANRNDFSNWLMARCEFKLAMKLRPQKVSDFKTLDEMREYLIEVFNESRRERQLRVMTDFSQQKFEFDSSYTKIGQDSLGGKGRGIAFLRTLLFRYNFNHRYKKINITVPSTVAVGTSEFDKFLKINNLLKYYDLNKKIDDHEIAKEFLKGKLSDELKRELGVVLNHFKKPLAVRSSSLLEDSQNHPFAGIYATYMIPNNHKDSKIRLKQLCQAIKLVYASVFYKDARVYIESTSAQLEEEKMAIIIQELVGNEYNDRFYPTFSGVAQSYNFYPVSHQKREDGIVSLAVGLGHSVVGGEKVLRFSPKYPEINPELSTVNSILENTQSELYVLNTKKSNITLTEFENSTLEKLNVADISKDGSLKYVASSYDKEDMMVRDSFSEKGPHLITFAGILKFKTFPFISFMRDILEAGHKSMGSPIEIEFAVNIDPKEKKLPIFSLIQIRPLILSQEIGQVDWNDTEIDKKKIVLQSNKALGHGIINDIKNIVFVSPETFDSSKTIEIVKEISNVNQFLNNNKYILIGPGRWGTQDRWLGIPVFWSDISNAKIIIETALEDFRVRPTQGTHFFQNIISKGIGYAYVSLNPKESYIDWQWLKHQKSILKQKYVNHIQLQKPLRIKFNGRTGKVLILKQ